MMEMEGIHSNEMICFEFIMYDISKRLISRTERDKEITSPVNFGFPKYIQNCVKSENYRNDS